MSEEDRNKVFYSQYILTLLSIMSKYKARKEMIEAILLISISIVFVREGELFN